MFPLKSGKICHLLQFLFNIVLEVTTNSIKHETEKLYITDRKFCSFFRKRQYTYLGNSNEFPKKRGNWRIETKYISKDFLCTKCDWLGNNMENIPFTRYTDILGNIASAMKHQSDYLQLIIVDKFWFSCNMHYSLFSIWGSMAFIIKRQ